MGEPVLVSEVESLHPTLPSQRNVTWEHWFNNGKAKALSRTEVRHWSLVARENHPSFRLL